jgi:outer membrane protein OmpA-like peptidoglycan-associated protein
MMMILVTACLDVWAQVPLRYDIIEQVKIINQSAINTPNLESSPAFIGDKIGYVYTGEKNKFFDAVIDEPFFDIGITETELDHTLTDRKTFYKRINSDLHEGAMSYDAHRNILYFTRSHQERSRFRNVDTTYLRIMSADLNAAHPRPEPIDLNVDLYSVCHPSVSTDGRQMIFSSNKPGGHGGMDLYIAYAEGNSWTGVLNLGKMINGPSHEVFPTWINDSILVFASNRSGGIGGLDLYITMLIDGEWSRAELLPKPFNSSFDDLGLIIRPNLKSGYFTSNRPGGRGKDDLYAWSSPEPILGFRVDDEMAIDLFALDKLTLDSVGDVALQITPLELDINNYTMSSFNIDMLNGRDNNELIMKLTPKNSTKHQTVNSVSPGLLRPRISKSKKYLFRLEAPGYHPSIMIYDYDQFSATVNMVMEPSSSEFEQDISDIRSEDTMSTQLVSEDRDVLIDLTDETYTFRNLYYEYNSAILAAGATTELDAVSRWMVEHPEVKIRIESHTDSRGTEAYNLQLSVQRAEAVRSYLTDLGIEADRIQIRGYGESRLLNGCNDARPCTDADHRVNRRTEMYIEKN